MAGKRQAIIDASAIVAVLSEKDQWHKLATPLFVDLKKPLFTCESAISESCYLVGVNRKKSVLSLLKDGVIEIGFSPSDEIDNIARLMAKYDSVPMSFADSCLVRMSEILDAPIFTFDADFRIYRRHGNRKIPLIGLEEV